MGNGGFSTKRLERVRAVLSRHVESGYAPGVVAIVARRGQVHVSAVGDLAFGGGASMTVDTIFRITSMTKPLAAACAMTLVEDCTLRLDDPVDGYLPELSAMRVLARPDGPIDDTVPADRPITLRDLLTFRLGTGIVFAEPGTFPIAEAMTALELGQGMPEPDRPPPTDEWIRRLGALPLIYQPGERWMYNTGSDVLGVLISRAAGLPLEDAMRERVFTPLGMDDTAFSVERANLGRLATEYGSDPYSGETMLHDLPDGQWSRPPAFPAGGSGLVSTPTDYFAFAAAMLAGGTWNGHRVLSRKSVELMTMDHLTAEQKALSGFGPGFFDAIGWGFCMSVRTRRTDLAHSVGSYGWDGGFGTAWSNDPAEDLVTILMTQRMLAAPGAPPMFQDFWTATYQALED